MTPPKGQRSAFAGRFFVPCACGYRNPLSFAQIAQRESPLKNFGYYLTGTLLTAKIKK